MKTTMKILGCIGVVTAIAALGGYYIHELVATIVMSAFVVYMIGGITGWWTFFGYPASIGYARIGR